MKLYIKRVAKIAVIIFLLIIAEKTLEYIYDDTNTLDPWDHILFHSYYENEGQIDNIYVGSSHVFCDINPSILDELNGQKNFNLSTGQQRLNESYYLIKDAIHRNDIKNVYLELYYQPIITYEERGFIEPITNDDYYITYSMKTVDNTRFSLAKIEFVYSLLKPDPEYFLEVISPFIRSRSYLFDLEHIKSTIQAKNEDDYLNYRYSKTGEVTEVYQPNGYHYSDLTLDSSSYLVAQNEIINEHPIGSLSQSYLEKIISYCQKNNVTITLFVSPIDDTQVTSSLHYDNYVNQVKSIADTYGVAYYDFNLAKEEYATWANPDCFQDVGHLNDNGATIFTNLLYQVTSSSNPNQYFYDSYQQKLDETQPKIYGAYYEYPYDANADELPLHILSNRNQDDETALEYQISLYHNWTNLEQIQDFSTNTSFSVPLNENGTIFIQARAQGSDNIVAQIALIYGIYFPLEN